MGPTYLPLPFPMNDLARASVSDDFTRSVRDALRHLHDPVYLQTHPLVRLVPEPGDSLEFAGKRLQRHLLDAIATLRPGAGMADARARRRYELLALRYAEALEIAEVAARLAISRREYNREHRQALDAIAALLSVNEPHAQTPAPLAMAKVTRDLAATAALPMPSTSFVGREREIAEVLGLILTTRLVTLTGPPGTGKTRLALQAAQTLRARSGGTAFRGGVAFVPLAPVLDPGLVAAAIGAAFGVRETPGRSLFDAVATCLSRRPLLLILDNFEHVLDAAPVVSQLMQACPQLTVLATSRASLHLSGEHEFVVPPLGVPEAAGSARPAEAERAEAVRLYVERARALGSGFLLTEQNASAVIEICRRLDGLPLAIELAASRSRVFPPSTLLRQLGGGTAPQGSPLRLLTTGPRDAPTRQQTLRGAIDWSYQLLTADEQRLLARLSVFTGGWTLEALEAVATADGDLDVVEGIASLLDKSLVQREETADGEPRFFMLETIREFGLERLTASGEETRARNAHAAWYAGFAERVEAEMGNLRAALAWAIEHRDPDMSLRLATALSRVWLGHGPYHEGRVWLKRVLALGGGPPQARVAAQVALSRLFWLQGHLTRAAMVAEEALAMARANSDRAGTASALLALGEVLDRQGSLDRASRCHEEALAMFRDLGDRQGIAEALGRLGIVAWLRGDVEQFAAMAEEALTLWREIGDRAGIMSALDSLSLVARLSGDLARQAALAREALILSQELDDPLSIASALWTAAAIADERGHPILAARLFGAEEALRKGVGFILDPAFAKDYDDQVTSIRARLGPAALTRAWDSGRALAPAQALVEARALLDRLATDPATSAASQADSTEARPAQGASTA